MKQKEEKERPSGKVKLSISLPLFLLRISSIARQFVLRQINFLKYVACPVVAGSFIARMLYDRSRIFFLPLLALTDPTFFTPVSPFATSVPLHPLPLCSPSAPLSFFFLATGRVIKSSRGHECHREYFTRPCTRNEGIRVSLIGTVRCRGDRSKMSHVYIVSTILKEQFAFILQAKLRSKRNLLSPLGLQRVQQSTTHQAELLSH